MSMIAYRCCRPVDSVSRLTVGLFLLFVLGSAATTLRAQTIRIRLVNGRTGRAMAGTCINVWVGNERKSAMAIPTGRDGIASLRLTDQEAEIDTKNHWSRCGDFGVIRPVVKYSRSIRINVGYVLCQVRQADHTWLATMSFPTRQVLESGVVSENTCGKAKALPTPGEITIFVRPLHWWERLRE